MSTPNEILQAGSHLRRAVEYGAIKFCSEWWRSESEGLDPSSQWSTLCCVEGGVSPRNQQCENKVVLRNAFVTQPLCY